MPTRALICLGALGACALPLIAWLCFANRSELDWDFEEARLERLYRRQAFIYCTLAVLLELGTAWAAVWFRERNRIAAVGCWVAVGFGALGFVLSQFAPVFGGLLETHLAEPFSPARIALIPVHVLAFAALGLALGCGFAYASSRSPGPGTSG